MPRRVASGPVLRACSGLPCPSKNGGTASAPPAVPRTDFLWAAPSRLAPALRACYRLPALMPYLCLLDEAGGGVAVVEVEDDDFAPIGGDFRVAGDVFGLVVTALDQPIR